MTNEEKSKELANYYAGENDCIESAAYSSALAMAEWKEEQMIRAAKNAFCEMCPHGPCPYPVDNGEECKRRFAFGEKIYNNQ